MLNIIELYIKNLIEEEKQLPSCLVSKNQFYHSSSAIVLQSYVAIGFSSLYIKNSQLFFLAMLL